MYIHVVNRLDDAVDEAFTKRNVAVELIAHASHLEPPAPERTYDGSVLVNFAPIGRGYATSIDESDADANRRYADLLETWRETVDGPLAVYEYYRRCAWHSMPVIMPDIIGRDVDYYARTGVDGLDTYTEPADWLPCEITYRLVGGSSGTPTLT